MTSGITRPSWRSPDRCVRVQCLDHPPGSGDAHQVGDGSASGPPARARVRVRGGAGACRTGLPDRARLTRCPADARPERYRRAAPPGPGRHRAGRGRAGNPPGPVHVLPGPQGAAQRGQACFPWGGLGGPAGVRVLVRRACDRRRRPQCRGARPRPHHAVDGDWEYDFYRSFAGAGLTDAFRISAAPKWFERSSQGYRFDHTFVSTPHGSQVRRCSHDHGPAELGLTDYAALVLVLGQPSAEAA